VTQNKEEILGKILQEERKAKKISQEKLAKLTGLDRTFISLIENGKRNPSFTTILKNFP
jgi:transcriptional regulator with XRE-family HTH domain